MHEYEIFIEEINPCGGEKYSKKTLINCNPLCRSVAYLCGSSQ